MLSADKIRHMLRRWRKKASTAAKRTKAAAAARGMIAVAAAKGTPKATAGPSKGTPKAVAGPGKGTPKAAAGPGKGTPSDVPSGHLAVCVGASSRRFVVRATYLNHPVFGKLLDQAEEEYGYTNSGPLAIPCDEVYFEELLGYLGESESSKSARFTYLESFRSCKSARFTSPEDFQCCRFGARTNSEFWPESRPLLNGLPDQPISAQ